MSELQQQQAAAAASGSGNNEGVDVDIGDQPIQVGQFKINGMMKQFAIVPRSKLHSREHLHQLLHDYWNLSTPSFIIETNSSNRDLENTITTANTKHFLKRIYPDLPSYGNTSGSNNKQMHVTTAGVGTQTSMRPGDGADDDEESTEMFTNTHGTSTTSRMSNILGRPSPIGHRIPSTASSSRRSEPSLGTTQEELGEEEDATQSSTTGAADDVVVGATGVESGGDDGNNPTSPSPSSNNSAGNNATARPPTSNREESYNYRISHGFAPKSVRDSFTKFYDRVQYMPPVKQRILNHYEWVEFSNTYLHQKLDKCLSSIVSAADMTNGWILCRGSPTTNEKLLETAMECSRARPNVLVVDDNTWYKYPKVLRELHNKTQGLVNLKDALDISKPVKIIPIDCGNDWIDNYDIKRRYGQDNNNNNATSYSSNASSSHHNDGDSKKTKQEKFLWNDNKRNIASTTSTQQQVLSSTATSTSVVARYNDDKKKRYKPYLGARWEAQFPWKVGNYFIFTDDCENFNADLIGPSGYLAINGGDFRPTTTTTTCSSYSGTPTMNFNETGFSTGYLIREAVARTRPCIIFDNTGRGAQKYARLIREIKWRDELEKKIHQLEKIEQEPGFQHIVKKNRDSLLRRILGLDNRNTANNNCNNKTDKLRFRFSDFDNDLKDEILKSSVERLLSCLDKDLIYYQRELDIASKTISRRVVQTFKWLMTWCCCCCYCCCSGFTTAIVNVEDKEERTEEEDYRELRKELKRYAGYLMDIANAGHVEGNDEDQKLEFAFVHDCIDLYCENPRLFRKVVIPVDPIDDTGDQIVGTMALSFARALFEVREVGAGDSDSFAVEQSWRFHRQLDFSHRRNSRTRSFLYFIYIIAGIAIVAASTMMYDPKVLKYPNEVPSMSPSGIQTMSPSGTSTMSPSGKSTKRPPAINPSDMPTMSPSGISTMDPSGTTGIPTMVPSTRKPSGKPSSKNSQKNKYLAASLSLTASPSAEPTKEKLFPLEPEEREVTLQAFGTALAAIVSLCAAMISLTSADTNLQKITEAQAKIVKEIFQFRMRVGKYSLRAYEQGYEKLSGPERRLRKLRGLNANEDENSTNSPETQNISKAMHDARLRFSESIQSIVRELNSVDLYEREAASPLELRNYVRDQLYISNVGDKINRAIVSGVLSPEDYHRFRLGPLLDLVGEEEDKLRFRTRILQFLAAMFASVAIIMGGINQLRYVPAVVAASTGFFQFLKVYDYERRFRIATSAARELKSLETKWTALSDLDKQLRPSIVALVTTCEDLAQQFSTSSAIQVDRAALGIDQPLLMTPGGRRGFQALEGGSVSNV